MKNNVHKKFLDLIERGAIGTTDVADCCLCFETFVPKGSYGTQKSKEDMRDALYEVLMSGPHPTLNPFMDRILDVEEKPDTFKEALLKFIIDNVEWSSNECDQKNDVATMKISLKLLSINCLPFFDQEDFQIEKASVQTPLFRYDIEV